MGLRLYLKATNKRLDAVEGAVGVVGIEDSDDTCSLVGDEDVTDWHTRGFRYRM